MFLVTLDRIGPSLGCSEQLTSYLRASRRYRWRLRVCSLEDRPDDGRKDGSNKGRPLYNSIGASVGCLRGVAVAEGE